MKFESVNYCSNHSFYPKVLKGSKVCSASGRRFRKRVPLDDLDNNGHPSQCMLLKVNKWSLEAAQLYIIVCFPSIKGSRVLGLEGGSGGGGGGGGSTQPTVR